MKTVALLLAVLLFCGSMLSVHAADAPKATVVADGNNQAIFLICPHKEKYSAWSLSLSVDKADPSKVLALNLEKLTKKNSIDAGSYEAVVTASKDAKTEREQLGKLEAAQFASSEIKVEKDKALDVSLTPLPNNEFRLMVSVRISADERFTIGGKDQAKHDVIVKFDKNTKTWQSVVKVMQDFEKNVVKEATDKVISGIVFPVSGTGIYRIFGAIIGMDEPIQVLDRF